MRNTFLCMFFVLSLLMMGTIAYADTGTAICLEDYLSNTDARGNPIILYTGRAGLSQAMRSEADRESASLGTVREDQKVQIFGFDQEWLFCWDSKVGIYYLRRQNVDDIRPVSGNDVPYGVTPNRFVAVAARDTHLRTAPDENAQSLFLCPKGSRMSLWMIEDGWAVAPYDRQVGYLYVGDLQDLTPVAPDAGYAQEGDILSAFTTYYSLDLSDELNAGRIENIRVSCEYISQAYAAGSVFDFNAVAGPYRRSRGYRESPVFINGESVAGYGGGTCQVSTTLYSALLQLYDGITILYSRPHGASGSAYAPHGVDSAVGRSGGNGVMELNLEFRNTYDFPIVIDATADNGVLCVCLRKGA